MTEDYATLKQNIIDETIRYFHEYPNVKSLVLGLSGGIDSALVAALAREVCDILGLKLIGRSLPITTNKEDEIQRARAIGLAFCDEFIEVELHDAYTMLVDELDDSTDEVLTPMGLKIAEGNIKARLRMIQLYHLAGLNKGVVLSTDNLTELLLGFWTLHGDVGDYGMIQQLWKTEVYGLATYIADQYYDANRKEQGDALIDCVNANPTDGLGITNSDLDQLGLPTYEDVDNVLYAFMEGEADPEKRKELLNNPVIKRYNATHFKRENPYNIPRGNLINYGETCA